VAAKQPPHHLSGSCHSVCPMTGPGATPYGLEPGTISRISYPPPWGARSRPLVARTAAARPRLRGRLTLGRLTLPRNPWAYGERVSHSFYRYSYRHQLSQQLHHSFRYGFAATAMLPYHCPCGQSEASVQCLSPVTFSAQPRLTSELLRYL
jgi:hypothetical protein